MATKIHSLWNAVILHRLQFILKQCKLLDLGKEESSLSFSRYFLLLFLLVGPLVMAQSFTEDFESGIPNDWGLFTDGSTTINWEHTTDGFQSNGAALLDPALDNIGAGNLASYYLVTPYMSLPENAQIHFMSKFDALGDNNTVFKVMISTAPQPDLGDFIMIDSWNASEVEDYLTYGQYMIDLSSIGQGVEVYIAFVVENTQPNATASGTAWFVDDLQVITACQPVNPEDVVFSGITTFSAEMTWTHPTATYFDIQVVEHGEAIDENAGDGINSLSYSITNLNPETEYDVYIRTICVGSITSEWQLAGTFESLRFGVSCEAPIVIDSVPFHLETRLMDFQNPSVSYDGIGGGGCLPGQENTNHLNGAKIFLSYTAEDDGLINLSQFTLPWTPGTECYGNASSVALIYEDCDAIGIECLAGLHTQDVEQPAHINNFEVEQGRTYIIVISSEFEQDASVCLEFDLKFSACAAPSIILLTDISQEKATVSWDNVGDFADSWEYSIQLAGEGEPTGSGTATSTNVEVELTSLSPGTAYDLYIRSNCGGDFGEWSSRVSFITQCNVEDLPYFNPMLESNSASSLDCWYILDGNNDGSSWRFQYDGANYPFPWDAQNHNEYLITPQVDLSGGVKRMRFEYIAYGGPVAYSIKASTNGIGVSNFTTVIQSSTSLSETDYDEYQEVIIIIPENITDIANLAFHINEVLANGAYTFSIRNVYIEDMPSCSDPLSLLVGETTETTAVISWDAGFDETQWEVFVKLHTEEAPTIVDTGIIVNSNEYTLTNLEPSSWYEYYVRAYCNDDQSEWVGPVEFFTACIAEETPYFESFNDDDPDTRKFCWETINNPGDGITLNIEENSVNLMMPMFGGPAGWDDWLISPPIMAEGMHAINFKYRANRMIFSPDARAGIQVLISTTDTDLSSFEVLESTFYFTNGNYLTKSIYFQEEGTVYIALRIAPDYSGSITGMSIDDFEVTDAPACPQPTNLEVTNITANSVNIEWTQGFVETDWHLAVQVAGSGEPVDYITVNSTTQTINDLEVGTEYEVYVRASCELEDSEWIGPVKFTTLCDAFASPFIETFEHDSESKNCWRVVNANEDSHRWTLSSTMNPYDGGQSAAIMTPTNGANNDWLISPTISITENQRIRFYYSVMDEFFVEDLKVLISTDGIELDSFTTELFDTGQNPINNEEYREMILDIPAGITGNINIAFYVPPFPSFELYRGQSLFIDNIIVEDIPECPQPSNLRIESLSDTSVSVLWDVNGEEDAWEVVVVPEGETTPEEGEVNPDYIYVSTASPFIITNLESSQRYFVYVRAICSEDSVSNWIGPVEVVTLCDLDNQCVYTVTLHSDYHLGVAGGIDIIQNGVVMQTLEFPTGTFAEPPVPTDYIIYLCKGVEFSLFWDSLGTAPNQYPEAYVLLHDSEGILVFDSRPGIGIPRTVLYRGVAQCGEDECPMPTNLQVDENMEFTWDAGGEETQWEVAFKPVDDGTLPQSGTLIDSANYTPILGDFVDPTAMTYDFFVRAVCNEEDSSYWVGPYSFARGDSPETAAFVPVNETESCDVSASNISFRNTHLSDQEVGVDVVSDVWLSFIATSPVHIIEVNGFTGNFYQSSGDEDYPNMITTLFKEEGGSLIEMESSINNVIIAWYGSELEVGEEYKIRLSLIGPEISTRLFNVCITTPEDNCSFDNPNYNFERPVLDYFSGISSIMTQYVVSGWRKNMLSEHGNAIFYWESLNADGFEAFSGSQVVQLVTDEEEDYVEDEPRGLYRDFDTSEVTAMDYSFVNSARGVGTYIQLFAGPVDGPLELVTEAEGFVNEWTINEGVYEVPEGQDKTRFLFRSKDYAHGNLLDQSNFIPNNNILSDNETIDCATEFVSFIAYGVGEWSASEVNPAEVSIADPTSNESTVSGFTAPGEYTFYWTTRYCEDSITITYEGIGETPEVESPIEYCQDASAEPLTASMLEGFDLVFYTEEVGGEGIASITPDTSELGTTTYYVAYVDAEGCEGVRVPIEVIVLEIIIPVVEFSYDLESYCTSSIAPIIEYTEGFTLGGTFTAAPSGLAIDATNGSINLASSTPGVYEIMYTIEEGDGLCEEGDSYSVEIEIHESLIPEVVFSYDAEVYCLALDAPVIEYVEDFTLGGTFTATPDGLAIDAADGSIDLEFSTPGVYEVTYTIDSDEETCLVGDSYTVEIEIEELFIPVVEFFYDLDAYCPSSSAPTIEYAEGFTLGGTFTATPNGLAIDATDGSIDLEISTPGVYEITYTIEEGDGLCEEGGSYSVEIEIYELIIPVVGFSYDSEVYCPSLNTPVIEYMEGFTFGGTFTATPNGLAIDAADGSIDLEASTPGIYEVTYTIDSDEETCLVGDSYTVDVEVYELIIPVVGFSYDLEVYCSTTNVPVIEYTDDFTFGGTFTATPNGLVLDSLDGSINLESSTSGVYLVTYTIDLDEELCQLGDSYSVEVEVVDAVAFSIVTYCDAGRFMLEPEFSLESDVTNASYTWRDTFGSTVATSRSLDFASAMNSNVDLPVVLSLTIEIGECEFTQEIEIDNAMCEIPKGISPNGDGLNDFFDLSGMAVQHITIFNRYGTKVYSKSNYTNQWAGQSDKDKELPDGTYYYVIETKAGESISGWVYVNRAY